MRLINRSKKNTDEAAACSEALRQHVERFGEYGRRYTQTLYTVKVGARKITVEVVVRRKSYVAQAMCGARRLCRLPAAGG
ncbi:DUF4060 family protein [Enterobacter sp. 214E4]|uniref:DUF4060 family protein n=1 Tax=Enterobacter sp. 214E4 TaxID=3077759 RepID=UPI002A7F3368|nr:DUF4060 family protein [Enterobacter sp. 214E4]